VQQFDDNTNVLVLQIKFPISRITHSNLTNDSSVGILTNRGTIVPCIKLHGDSYMGIKYAGVMLKQQLIRPIDWSTAIFVERKNVTPYVLAAAAGPPVSYIFFVLSQDPKGKMKFARTPDTPVIAGDGITYGVACL
jgi:hypothetical protein